MYKMKDNEKISDNQHKFVFDNVHVNDAQVLGSSTL